MSYEARKHAARLIPRINTTPCPACSERCDQCAPEVELIDERSGARLTNDGWYKIAPEDES